MRRSRLISAALALAGLACTSLAACEARISGYYTIEERGVSITGIGANMDNGRTGVIRFDIGPDTESFVIEVKGDRGIYGIDSLVTPSGHDVIADGSFTSRTARAYGVASWLYPNSMAIEAEEGRYSIVFTGGSRVEDEGRTVTGSVSEHLSIRIVEKQRLHEDRCGLEVDFMVDERALDISQAAEAAERILIETNARLSQAGIQVVNVQPIAVNLLQTDVDVETQTVIPVVEDVLRQARHQGFARDGSLHVVLVHSIGGVSEPKGRSLGLPGPYSADKPNSAVLIATEHFNDGGVLNTDELSETLAHEIGHYLGLFHTSERDRMRHDPLEDTPECTIQPGELTASCNADYNDNLMSTQVLGRRWVFTEQQGEVMRRHPLCLSLDLTDYVEPTPLPDCDLECEQPNTCVIWNGYPQCLEACDNELPNVDQCANSSYCTLSDDQVYVCRPDIWGT